MAIMVCDGYNPNSASEMSSLGSPVGFLSSSLQGSVSSIDKKDKETRILPQVGNENMSGGGHGQYSSSQNAGSSGSPAPSGNGPRMPQPGPYMAAQQQYPYRGVTQPLPGTWNYYSHPNQGTYPNNALYMPPGQYPQLTPSGGTYRMPSFNNTPMTYHMPSFNNTPMTYHAPSNNNTPMTWSQDLSQMLNPNVSSNGPNYNYGSAGNQSGLLQAGCQSHRGKHGSASTNPSPGMSTRILASAPSLVDEPVPSNISTIVIPATSASTSNASNSQARQNVIHPQKKVNADAEMESLITVKWKRDEHGIHEGHRSPGRRIGHRGQADGTSGSSGSSHEDCQTVGNKKGSRQRQRATNPSDPLSHSTSSYSVAQSALQQSSGVSSTQSKVSSQPPPQPAPTLPPTVLGSNRVPTGPPPSYHVIFPTGADDNPPVLHENNDCTVCCEREINCVLNTCGHVCMCYECALAVKKTKGSPCPICRQPIKDVIRMYRS